mmetsp:Transcript_39898/g.105410  ORF Transcript_39898/g.105410 Transcript_39898/m.105410 type:complete len:204 (+) Transcript_39898:195-806(+)
MGWRVVPRIDVVMQELVRGRTGGTRDEEGARGSDGKPKAGRYGEIHLEAVPLLRMNLVECGARREHLHVEQPLRALAGELRVVHEQHHNEHHVLTGKVREIPTAVVQAAEDGLGPSSCEANKYAERGQRLQEWKEDSKREVGDGIDKSRLPIEWHEAAQPEQRELVVEIHTNLVHHRHHATRQGALEEGSGHRAKRQGQLAHD